MRLHTSGGGETNRQGAKNAKENRFLMPRAMHFIDGRRPRLRLRAAGGPKPLALQKLGLRGRGEGDLIAKRIQALGQATDGIFGIEAIQVLGSEVMVLTACT